MHPSELPSFASLAASRKQLRSRAARFVATLMVAALVVGGAGLASTRGVNPPNNVMSTNLTVSWSRLPAVTRQAAARTVDLTITVPGHVNTVAAMVLPGNLAVTTTPIPLGALLSASTPTRARVPVTWVGRDTTMGFSIVRLGERVPALRFAPMPATASVIAVAPVVTSVHVPLRFAWAATTLGDPTLRANGVVSYLATKPHANLAGLTDAIAVNSAGLVVAVLSGNHLWYSAQFVARVAHIVATGDGCHSSLGVHGTSAQGGGALVTSVARRSAGFVHLRAGDVITQIGGHDIESWNALLTTLYLTPAGTTTSITFLRGSLTHHAEVILACDL